MSALTDLSDRELQRKADGLRNRRDAFSFGSRHADPFVQELAQVTREQERRRDQRRAERQAADLILDGPRGLRGPAYTTGPNRDEPPRDAYTGKELEL